MCSVLQDGSSTEHPSMTLWGRFGESGECPAGQQRRDAGLGSWVHGFTMKLAALQRWLCEEIPCPTVLHGPTALGMLNLLQGGGSVGLGGEWRGGWRHGEQQGSFFPPASAGAV